MTRGAAVYVLLQAALLPAASDFAVNGVTQTQAVLSYVTSGGTCTVEVSESPAFSPVVADVDATLFAASNVDTRWVSLRSGTLRRIVVGTRTGQTASDGRIYSRALRERTVHYVRISGCGATVTGTFTTAALAWGAGPPEVAPFAAGGFGNYGWPTIDWSDRTRWYIDPLTGASYKPIGYPGDFANRYPASGQYVFGAVGEGATWASRANLLSGSAGTLATASDTSAIYAGIDPALTTPYLQPMTGINDKAVSIDNIQVRVYGNGSDAAAANRTVSLCWSVDWSTCYTDAIEVVLPTGAAALADEVPAESDFTTPFFGGWGGTARALNRLQLGRAGTVTVTGSTVTLNSAVGTSTAFDPDWPAGARLHIAGSSPTCADNLCTVASVEGPTSLTIAETLALGPVAYYLAPALRVHKTTGTGTVSASLAHIVASSNNWGIPPGGSFEVCNQNKVSFSVDRSGAPSVQKWGRVCAIETWQSGGGAMIWIADDGEARLLSVFRVPSTVVNSADPRDYPDTASAYPFNQAFDPAIATRWYVQMLCQNGGAKARCLFKLDYTGDGRAWVPSPLYPLGNATQPASPSDNVAWSILTPPSQGLDVDAQITAQFPEYDASRWGTLTSSVNGATLSGYSFAFVRQGWGVGESPAGYVFLFDVRTGLFEQAWDTFTGTYSPSLKWGAMHATFSLGGPNEAVVLQSLNPQQLVWGAHTSAVLGVRRGGTYDVNTALPAAYDGSYDGACESNPYGVTGNNCVFLKIAGQPCKVSNLPNDNAWYPCPHDAARVALASSVVGDYSYDTATLDNGERLRWLSVVQVGPAEWNVMLQRDAIPSSVDPRCVGSRAHTNGWTLAMNLGGGRTCEISSLFLVNGPGNLYASPLFDHFDTGVSYESDLPGRWVSTRAYAAGGWAQMNTTYPPLLAANSIGFAGSSAPFLPPVQLYPSGRQWTADAWERRWTTNQRHYTQWGGITVTNISGNLYRVTGLGTADVKRLGWMGTAGRYLLLEQSSPVLGDTIAPSDTNRFCYAYRAGECRSGSNLGDVYVVVVAPVTSSTMCGEGDLTLSAPCVFVPMPLGAWGYQEDTTRDDRGGRWVRPFTKQPGEQRQGPFENVRPFPDGQFALWRSIWTDGLYSTDMIVRLPPAAPYDSVDRTQWQAVTVEVPAGLVSAAAVRFWYAETGGYCTNRAENCYAVAAALNSANAFAYQHEVSGGVSCASGCTVTVPAISGRVLYWQLVNAATLAPAGGLNLAAIR